MPGSSLNFENNHPLRTGGFFFFFFSPFCSKHRNGKRSDFGLLNCISLRYCVNIYVTQNEVDRFRIIIQYIKNISFNLFQANFYIYWPCLISFGNYSTYLDHRLQIVYYCFNFPFVKMFLTPVLAARLM